MPALFGAAAIRKQQRQPQLVAMVTLQGKKGPVRTKRNAIFRAFGDLQNWGLPRWVSMERLYRMAVLVAKLNVSLDEARNP